MADENDVAYYYSSGTIAEPLSSVSDEEYESPVFVPSRLVDRISNVPRFAHSPSIAYAASGDDQARQDYLEGAVFTSSIILLAFVVWLVILLVLKIMGSKRVGCASGKAPTYPSLESIQAANHTLERQYELDIAREQAEGWISGEASTTGGGGQVDGVVGEDMDQWLQEVKNIEKRMRRIRIVSLICGVVILPTSLALIVAGFRVLDGAFHETLKNVLVSCFRRVLYVFNSVRQWRALTCTLDCMNYSVSMNLKRHFLQPHCIFCVPPSHSHRERKM